MDIMNSVFNLTHQQASIFKEMVNIFERLEETSEFLKISELLKSVLNNEILYTYHSNITSVNKSGK